MGSRKICSFSVQSCQGTVKVTDWTSLRDLSADISRVSASSERILTMG